MDSRCCPTYDLCEYRRREPNIRVKPRVHPLGALKALGAVGLLSAEEQARRTLDDNSTAIERFKAGDLDVLIGSMLGRRDERFYHWEVELRGGSEPRDGSIATLT